MQQDTGKFRENTKDQYYTRALIAKECIESIISAIKSPEDYFWIEPSAGNGSFLKQLPSKFKSKSIGIDIEPKMESIEKGDFLEWMPPAVDAKPIVFGNPPFGKQGSLAKSFIKHAAKFAEIIAFILPRSFTKPSMSMAFPVKFHCIYEKELAKDSFEVNGKPYDVPCIFQIWEKKEIDRILAKKVDPVGFTYGKKGDAGVIMAVRRVGVFAGKCFLDTADKSPQSHYFLVFETKYRLHLQEILDEINKHIFPSNTVGPRSLSQTEVNEVINSVLFRIN